MKETATLDIGLFGPASHDEGFYVNTLSDHLATSHRHINKPHKHDFYVFVFFTSGRGTHDIDFTSYDVTPGSVFMLSPGQVHSWELSPDSEGFVFFHTASFYGLRYGNESVRDYPFFASLSNSRHATTGVDEQAALSQICTCMLEEYKNKARYRDRMIAGLMTAAYVTVSRLMESHPEPQYFPPLYQHQFAAFEDLVELHFKDIKSAAAYASLLAITPRHLNRISQAVSGKMTTAVIAARVMLEAKRMLAWSPQQLADIALELGYEDYAYFSKLFRKHTGKTPSEFVKSIGHRR